MKFGLQNSVMGWDDPWYPDASRTLMRTGEGQFFASQDPAPTKQAFIRLLQETFGVDFLMQHAMPQDERTEDFVRDMEKCGLQYMLGNEFGNINGPHCGDQPLRRAAKTRAAREAVGKLSRLAVRRNGALATASFHLPQGRPPAPVADDTLQDGRGVRGGDRKQCKATRRRIRYGRVRRMRLSLDDAPSGARRHAFIPQSAERRVSERHVRGRHGRVQTI